LAELNKDQRFQVLKGAFAADSRIAGKTILLIDDIYTTGATASSCSDVLVAQGAAAVYTLAVAAHRESGY
ncbi:MAG: hypothetical protein RR387_01455, partial [Clostridiales bacterium]